MFRRRSQTQSETAAPAIADEALEARDPRQKKGVRPTPRRSEAEATRKTRVSTPKDPKEARRVARRQMREEREAQRQALLTGDERTLPARDRGPMRAFVRDHIDARTGVAEFFLPTAVLILILSVMPSALLKNLSLLLWLVIIVLIVLDTVIMNFRLKRRLRDRFPGENLKGITMYAMMRSLQMRRLRLPKPRVARGEKI